MIIVSNTTAQTLAPGQAIVFDSVVWQSPKCGSRNEYFRPGTSNVRIVPGTYELAHSGNIGGTVAATAVQLSIALDGAPLPTTTVISTPAAVGDLNNVGRDTIAGIPCMTGGGSVTVVNNGTSTVTVPAGYTLKVVRKG